jgi:hypothetical protein
MREEKLGLIALVAIFAWIFVALPLIYLPEHSEFWKEPLGMKPGEWLLSLATFGLWYATWRLVRGADQNAERQLRAYVSLVGGAMVHATVDNLPGYLVQIELKNGGTTPGYEFTTWIMGPQVLSLDEVPFGPPRPESDRTSKSIIAPNTSAWINHYAIWNRGELEDVRNRKRAVFVWGGGDYKDAFGHPRKFIFRLMISGIEGTPNGWALSPHPLGYEAD